MLISITSLEQASQLVANATRVPVFYMYPGSDELWSFGGFRISRSNLKKAPADLLHSIQSVQFRKPIQLVNINKQADQMIVMPLSTHEMGEGRLILWPNYRKFLDPYPTDQHLEPAVLQPPDTGQLIHTASLLHYLLYNERLEEDQLPNEETKTDVLEISLMEQRENSLYHKSYLAEKKIFEQIRLGNKVKMLRYFNQHVNMNGFYGTLSKTDNLRSKKNLIIAAITMGTRAAIEGGLYSEVALTLSDTFIQYVESMPHIDSIQPVLEQILLEFTERVERVQRAHFSRDILMCQEYVLEHLYEDLDLVTLAAHVKMSPSYLSRKFKDETGEALKTFIQKQRIEEAKHLIVFTDYRLSEIYPLLNFHDQSYFIKIFKKHAGVTPKQYRDRFAARTF